MRFHESENDNVFFQYSDGNVLLVTDDSIGGSDVCATLAHPAGNEGSIPVPLTTGIQFLYQDEFGLLADLAGSEGAETFLGSTGYASTFVAIPPSKLVNRAESGTGNLAAFLQSQTQASSERNVSRAAAELQAIARDCIIRMPSASATSGGGAFRSLIDAAEAVVPSVTLGDYLVNSTHPTVRPFARSPGSGTVGLSGSSLQIQLSHTSRSLAPEWQSTPDGAFLVNFEDGAHPLDEAIQTMISDDSDSDSGTLAMVSAAAPAMMDLVIGSPVGRVVAFTGLAHLVSG